MTDEKKAESRGTLALGEAHPSAYSAKLYLEKLGIGKLYEYREAFASCAIESNRLGEVCSETLTRLLAGQPVSDRYLMGLAWAIARMELGEEKSDGSQKT